MEKWAPEAGRQLFVAKLVAAGYEGSPSYACGPLFQAFPF